MNPLAQKLIEQLNLEKHPEGGYFKETLSADEKIQPLTRLNRPLYTSILFLLHDQEVSHFHTIESDEIWVHHTGDPLDVVCIHPEGSLEIHHLGQNPDCVLQAVVKAGTLFGAYVPNAGTALVGCIVSPGFLYSEFKLYDYDKLCLRYPHHQIWIDRLGQKQGNT